jgi:LPS sulfotransferase NodH
MQVGKSVIFCATQRTGSTLIVDDFLNVVGHKRVISEILYHKTMGETGGPWSKTWDEVSKANTVRGYFIGKVMFHYTPYISRYIEHGSTAGPHHCLRFIPELFDSFYNFFADAIWVYIDRRNVFAQAVSMYLAESTQIWEKLIAGLRSRPPKPGVPADQVRYEYEKIKPYLTGFLAEREQWQLFFRHYKITPIRISYEEAAQGYPQYLKELLDKTELQAVEAPRPRRMLKVGDQRNEEWAEFLRNDVIAELYSRSHVVD